MIRCVCLVQGGQIADAQQLKLTATLQALCKRAFGQSLEVNWIAIAPGNGFTGGKPSTSSIVSVAAPEPLEQGRRASILAEICDLWMQETACSMNEIMAVVSDPRS